MLTRESCWAPFRFCLAGKPTARQEGNGYAPKLLVPAADPSPVFVNVAAKGLTSYVSRLESMFTEMLVSVASKGFSSAVELGGTARIQSSPTGPPIPRGIQRSVK